MNFGWHFIQNDNIIDSTYLPLLYQIWWFFEFVYLWSDKCLVVKRINLIYLGIENDGEMESYTLISKNKVEQ